MKRKKKVWALALAAIMMLASVFPVMAENAVPAKTDAALVTVENVEPGMTVTAYQIVEATYKGAGEDEGFTGYKIAEGVTGFTMEDLESLNLADEVNATAEQKAAKAETLKKITDAVVNGGYQTLTSEDLAWRQTSAEGAPVAGVYEKELAAGSWLIFVTGANANSVKVYNPMIASVRYKTPDENGAWNSNEAQDGTVDAAGKWEGTNENGQYVVYAKSSEPKPVKKIVTDDEGNVASGVSRDAGEKVKYQIKMEIPSYSSAVYEDVAFTVTDTLSPGLTFDTESSPVVKVGGDTVEKGNDTYSLTTEGQTLTVDFQSAYIMANGLKEVTIEYSAKLGEFGEGTVTDENFDPNDNDAKLTYTNGPGSTKDAKTKAYVYTFSIGAELSGTVDSVKGQLTHEIVKVGQGYEKKDTYEEWVTAGKTGKLQGATFKLTPEGGTDADALTAVSDADGNLTFRGLAEGTYTLVETAAPDNYSVDATPHTVKIEAHYNEDGTLDWYSITIDGEATSKYTASYTGEGTDKTITEITKDSTNTTFIQNVKLNELPSTGGMGTYLFTIVGVAVMATAAGLFMLRRKGRS